MYDQISIYFLMRWLKKHEHDRDLFFSLFYLQTFAKGIAERKQDRKWEEILVLIVQQVFKKF